MLCYFYYSHWNKFKLYILFCFIKTTFGNYCLSSQLFDVSPNLQLYLKFYLIIKKIGKDVERMEDWSSLMFVQFSSICNRIITYFISWVHNHSSKCNRNKGYKILNEKHTILSRKKKRCCCTDIKLSNNKHIKNHFIPLQSSWKIPLVQSFFLTRDTWFQLCCHTRKPLHTPDEHYQQSGLHDLSSHQLSP